MGKAITLHYKSQSVSIDYGLKNRIDGLVETFNRRFERLRGNRAFTGLIRNLDEEDAKKLALRLFGPGEHLASGIDGSMVQEEALEMLLFHVNATGYTAPFIVNEKGVEFDFGRMGKDEHLAVSSSIPLWLEDLPNVEVMPESMGSEITFSIMLLSELWLGIRALEKGVKLLFMDRPLSGTYQTISRDVRRFLKMEDAGLERLFGKEAKACFSLLLLLGPANSYVPERRSYRLHRLVYEMSKGEKGVYELAKAVGIEKDADIKRLVEKLKRFGEEYGALKFKFDEVRMVYEDFREKAYHMALSVVDRIFGKAKEHPLRIDEERWLTTPEINTINFALMNRLVELSREKGALVMGIAKDTNASEFVRAVVPLLAGEGLLPKGMVPAIRHDRVYLTMMASANPDIARPPWRSIGYDACFSTLLMGKEGRLKAARKTVSRERLFVRGYFQSRLGEKEGRELYRSPVFFYDRPFIPEFDESGLFGLEFEDRYGPQKAEVYLERKTNNLDNLILYLLSLSDNPEVFEAYGHNILLYMADKAVKAQSSLAKGLLKGIVVLKLTPLARKRKLDTIIRKFREERGEMEQRRKAST